MNTSPYRHPRRMAPEPAVYRTVRDAYADPRDILDGPPWKKKEELRAEMVAQAKMIGCAVAALALSVIGSFA